MNPVVVDILNINTIGNKECLQDSDSHKYEGDVKFNPKSFRSGQSVGYINVDVVSFELLFAQVRMMKELMFNVISLKMYNYLVGNVGSKWTTQTAVPWTPKMECSMNGLGMPGCYCPITLWSDKEIFMVHWQIHHIDKHSNLIV